MIYSGSADVSAQALSPENENLGEIFFEDANDKTTDAGTLT